jgi:hypothetical protein
MRLFAIQEAKKGAACSALRSSLVPVFSLFGKKPKPRLVLFLLPGPLTITGPLRTGYYWSACGSRPVITGLKVDRLVAVTDWF